MRLLAPSATKRSRAQKAETIRKSVIYQAILARPKDDRLEIVFGVRCYRASLLAGKETIPALVREISDAGVLEAQLIELSNYQ
jgi:ParB family chromosome partitioning protein